MLLYAEPEQALAAVEQMVEALRARGGKQALEAVQRQLQAAEAAGVGAATAAR